MIHSQTASTRGILNPRVAETKFHLSRHLPAADLRCYIDRYWLIHWDLRGQPPFVQETLSYPCVNLVFERGNSWVWGVDTGKFARRLEGVGQVFGVKFRPGAFYPFIQTPVSRFTDSRLSLEATFGQASAPLEAALFALDDSGHIAFVEDFLRQHLPEPDENVTLVNQIVDCIQADYKITQVNDLLCRCDLSKRSLQRLFNHYVGVSPKWVIQRCRLQEAAELMAQGTALDWAKLALHLGYFDQAHFIKAFKRVIGKTPAEYSRSLGPEARMRDTS